MAPHPAVPRPLRVPPLPFPFPLHIGTDICRISRVYSILAGPRGPRFIRRVLAGEELVRPRRHVAGVLNGSLLALLHTPVPDAPRPDARVGGRLPGVRLPSGGDDGPGGGNARVPGLWDAAVFMAGRFAAKEAAIKAHPHRKLTFHDIVVQRRREVAADAHADADADGVERGESKGGADADATESGPPVVVVRGEEGKSRDQIAMVSISHDGDYATAVCMGFDPVGVGAVQTGL